MTRRLRAIDVYEQASEIHVWRYRCVENLADGSYAVVQRDLVTDEYDAKLLYSQDYYFRDNLISKWNELVFLPGLAEAVEQFTQSWLSEGADDGEQPKTK